MLRRPFPTGAPRLPHVLDHLPHDLTQVTGVLVQDPPGPAVLTSLIMALLEAD